MEKRKELRDWVLEIKHEFGIELSIREIDPKELRDYKLEDTIIEQSDWLADWSQHTIQEQVPLVIFQGQKIEVLDDLLLILQA